MAGGHAGDCSFVGVSCPLAGVRVMGFLHEQPSNVLTEGLTLWSRVEAAADLRRRSILVRRRGGRGRRTKS